MGRPAVLERSRLRGHTIAIAAFALACNALLLAHYGVLHGGDTTRFLDGAARLHHGMPLAGKEASYIGYSALVAVSAVLGGGEVGVIGLQIVVASCAAAATYSLGRRLAGAGAGILAALLVVLDPDVGRWNLYLQSDALYTSAVLCAALTTVWAHDRRSMPSYATVAGVAICAALIRPNGWVLLVLVPLTLVWTSRVERGRKLAFVTLLVGISLASTIAVPAIRHAIEAEHPAASLSAGVVVSGYGDWHVSMPRTTSLPNADWVSSLGYPFAHPLATSRLAAARVGAELAHVRPYYSRTHNFAVALLLAALYALAAIGWCRHRRSFVARLIAVFVGAHMLVVALTFADWDGRFLTYVLPLISVLTAAGAVSLLAHNTTHDLRAAAPTTRADLGRT